MTRACTTIAALFLLPVGCSPPNVMSSGRDASADTTDATRPESGAADGAQDVAACASYAHAYCSRAFRCSSAVVQARYGRESDCESVYKSNCENQLRQPGTGSTGPRVMACANAIGGWPCDALLADESVPPDCVEPRGSRDIGDPCAVSVQCKSGYCGIAPGTSCGTCATAPKQGGSCETMQCPISMSCIAGRCVAPGQKGVECSDSSPCQAGLSCVSSGSSSFCQPEATHVGDSCPTAGAGCSIVDDLSCDFVRGVCVTAHLVPPGHACYTVDGVQTYCIQGTCSRGVCAKNPLPGEPCDLNQAGSCIVSACVVRADGGTKGTCEVHGSSSCP